MSFINPLDILAIFKSHKDWMDWEPETIWKEVSEHLPKHGTDGHEIPRIMKDIVMAVKLCLINPMPWERWNVFEKVCVTFNNEIPVFDIVQKPTLYQVSLAVEYMNKIRNYEFDAEVENYISTVAVQDGFLYLPDNLQFAQERLNLCVNGKAVEREAISIAWKQLKVKNELNIKSDDNLVGVQTAKLLAIDKYVKQHI